MTENQSDSRFELIESLIKKIHQLIGPGVTRSTCLKSLYLLTRQLDQDNEIRKALPFYWFYKGPLSEPFQQAHHNMYIQKTMNKGSPGEDGHIYYCDKEDIDSKIEEENSEAFKMLEKILNDGYDIETKNSTKLIHDCYRNYAPFDFMPFFNIEFRDKYNEMYIKILYDEDQEGWKNHFQGTLSMLETCEKNLPDFPEYEQFNDYFKIYVRCFKRAFNSSKLLRDDTIRRLFATHTKELRDDIWKCFEEITRCLDIGHDFDSRYEKMVDMWKLYANETSLILGQFINFYHDNVTIKIGWNESLSVDKIFSDEYHIPLIELEWMAKENTPSNQFSKQYKHLDSGCQICKENFRKYKKMWISD